VRWGTVALWLSVGVAALLSSFWVPWFEVTLVGITFNVGWPALIYGGLLLAKNVLLIGHLQFSQRELHDWGDTLSEVTGEIIERLENDQPTSQIATELEQSKGLPKEVTLKYIIALGHYHKKAQR